jgi:phosphatidylglycerophosphatase A
MEPLLAGFFGGWVIVLILAVILILVGARGLPYFGEGHERESDALNRALRELFRLRPVQPNSSDVPSQPHAGNMLILWLAQGFNVGRIRWAPGTFGSLVGLLWFAMLLSTQNIWWFASGALAGIFMSIWICGKAEEILRERDPSSIVLDEICAMPLCFVPWLVSEWLHKGVWPSLGTFFGPKSWYITVVIFVLFRAFDILKPWPVRQSQRLPSGWGVVMDDVLAALYVCALSLLVFH